MLLFISISVGNLHPFSLGSWICRIFHNPLCGPSLLRLSDAVITYHLVENQTMLIYSFSFYIEVSLNSASKLHISWSSKMEEMIIILCDLIFFYTGNIDSKVNRNIDRKKCEILQITINYCTKKCLFSFKKMILNAGKTSEWDFKSMFFFFFTLMVQEIIGTKQRRPLKWEIIVYGKRWVRVTLYINLLTIHNAVFKYLVYLHVVY